MLRTTTHIGLCGAHRTGKTTLAYTLAAQHRDVLFMRTNTSGVFAAAGIDPAAQLDLETRLAVQHLILDHYDELWHGPRLQDFVTDRTPLDLVAYTLADVNAFTAATPAQLEAVDRYIARCFDLTNSIFDLLVIVQPGIPPVAQPGKAIPNPAYVEHLNSLVHGLCFDERTKPRVIVIPRNVTDLHQRLDVILTSVTARTALAGRSRIAS